MLDLQPTYTRGEYTAAVISKYARILGTLFFIAIGLALYNLRRIRIMRAIGSMKGGDAFKVVYKRVTNFNFDGPDSQEVSQLQQHGHHLHFKRHADKNSNIAAPQHTILSAEESMLLN